MTVFTSTNSLSLLQPLINVMISFQITKEDPINQLTVERFTEAWFANESAWCATVTSWISQLQFGITQRQSCQTEAISPQLVVIRAVNLAVYFIWKGPVLY